jgi:hypothetical protein
MKLAIMQPYLFPFLGYFQLIAAVDKFVIYDDVTFIKRGWINRNHILLHGKPHLFTVPLQGASQNLLIRDIALHPVEYPKWREKFLKTIAVAYADAPFYGTVREMLLQVLDVAPASIADLARQSLLMVCRYLDLPTQLLPTSSVYLNSHLRAQDRILDICVLEGAKTYFNTPGGRELYSDTSFQERGVALRFLRSQLPAYPQPCGAFVPNLSIIDVMMFNSVETIRSMLEHYELDPAT